MKCHGRNADDHCCYINGKPCLFLEENTEVGFRWSCGLRRELGSWDAVLADPRYYDGPESPKELLKKWNYDCKSYQCRNCAKIDMGIE